MAQTLEKPATETTKKPDFGNGRYSQSMLDIYDGLMHRFNVPADKAERIARQAGSDAGASQRNATATFKVGKSNKDGKTSIKDVVQAVKGVTLTNPLACVRALQWIDEAGKNFVSYGFTKWTLTPELVKWIDEMEIKPAPAKVE